MDRDLSFSSLVDDGAQRVGVFDARDFNSKVSAVRKSSLAWRERVAERADVSRQRGGPSRSTSTVIHVEPFSRTTATP